MKKNQQVGVGRARSAVELGSSPRRSPDDSGAEPASVLAGAIGRSAVAHDDVVGGRRDRGQAPADGFFLVEGGDDEGGFWGSQSDKILPPVWYCRSDVGTRGRMAKETTGSTDFSHLDAEGRASMVDVSGKPLTRRVAEASCKVLLGAETVGRLSSLPKGDAHAVARIAGIQAAKRTGEWIPLAHPLAPEDVEVVLRETADGVEVKSRVVVTARTGAEMEALVACAGAALALYDMVKAVERGAVITDLQLEAKTGGTRGDFRRGSE